MVVLISTFELEKSSFLKLRNFLQIVEAVDPQNQNSTSVSYISPLYHPSLNHLIDRGLFNINRHTLCGAQSSSQWQKIKPRNPSLPSHGCSTFRAPHTPSLLPCLPQLCLPFCHATFSVFLDISLMCFFSSVFISASFS